jgi:hypothetical protein
VPQRTPASGSVPIVLTLSAALLAITFARQRFLGTLFLTRLQIEGSPLDFFNDVLSQDLALEAFERALQALAFVNLNFSQLELTSVSK